MKFNRHVVVITVEVADLKSVKSVVDEALDCMDKEVVAGNLQHSDGDTVTWTHDQQGVTI